MIYLTVRNTSGGNHGHQLKDLIGGYTIAKVYGFQYVHSFYPYLESFALGVNEKPIHEIEENIAYLRFGGPYWNGINYQNASSLFGEIESKNSNRDVLVTIENALRIFPSQTIKWFKDGLIKTNVFDEVYSELTSKYRYKHKTRLNSLDKSLINIVVHINRGESYDRDKYPDHFASDWNVRFMFDLSYFENIFNQIRQVMNGKKYLIHIYTESLNSEEIVERFSNQEDIQLHIGKNRDEGDNELVRSIFHDFVTSDIFVPCNSSFSAMASLYRKGLPTIYHPHAHLFDLPEDDFYPTDPLGNFDFERLNLYLRNNAK